jgi:hypothetical protein
MSMQNLHICALATQKTWRDLAHLALIAEAVDWLTQDDLACAPQPAVICGLEAYQAPQTLGELLKQRSTAGLATILVPRFRAGNLAAMLGAPASIMVQSSEAGFLAWQDGESYGLPVFSVLETPMVAQRWATTDAGCCILAWRSGTAKGPVVLCTASVAGPALGADREIQRLLLDRIITSAAALQPHIQTTVPPVPATDPLDLNGFLTSGGGDAAAVLLTLYAARGEQNVDLAHLAETWLGMRLSQTLLERAMDFTTESPEAIVKALIKHGWRAHLRRIDQLLQKDDIA